MTLGKLREVLLIDDEEADNFLHARVIRRTGCVENVAVAVSGRQALDYLTTAHNGAFPRPDVVFLDINMPVMNGWEFLDEYDRLPADARARVVVVMLTTSLDPDDRRRAEERDVVGGLLRKPLTEEAFLQLVREHFPGVEPGASE